MSVIAKGETSARAIKNLFKETEDPQFVQSGRTELITKLEYLRHNWDNFVKSHEELLSAITDDDEKEEQLRVYDTIEKMFLRVEVILRENIESFSENNEDQLSENEQSSVENDEGNESANNNAFSEPSKITTSTPNASVNNNQSSNVRPSMMSQQAWPTQPIYVQCGSNRQIENTWGEFEGKLTQWQGFHDRFKAAVHDNESIPRIFKFLHLQKSLKGKAAAALGEWAQTEENYLQAWERLKQLYSRKYHTSKELLRKFNNLQKLDRTSGFMLQKLCNTTHEVMRQLKTLNHPVEHYDLIFVHGLHDRLDLESSTAWELHRTSENPSITEMLDFLDRRAKAMTGAYVESENANRKRTISLRDEKRSTPNNSSGPKSENKSENRACAICKENHAVHKCSTFLKLNLTERRKKVKDLELCYNCLNPSHTSKDCKASVCKRCEKKHNSLLCPENPYNRSVNAVQARPPPNKLAKKDKLMSKK